MKEINVLISLFGMAAMPFLCNGTLLLQCNLPRVLQVIIYKYASCFIPDIVSFLILHGEWSSLVFKDFKKYFCFKPNVFIFCFVRLFWRLLKQTNNVRYSDGDLNSRPFDDRTVFDHLNTGQVRYWDCHGMCECLLDFSNGLLFT